MRRWQFSIRQLLVVVTLLGLVAAAGWYWRAANERATREEAIRALVAAVKSPDNSAQEVRNGGQIIVAAERIRELGAVNQAALVLADIIQEEGGKFAFPARLALDDLGTSALTYLLNTHDDPVIRYIAAQGFFHLGPKAHDSAAALKAALDDPNELVRINAAMALVAVDRQSADIAMPILVKALDCDVKLMRTGAAQVMASIDTKLYPRVAPTLLELLDFDDRNIRLNAAHAIGKYGTDAASAVPELIELLRKERYFWLVQILADIAGPEESPIVEECFLWILASDQDVALRSKAAGYLGRVAALRPDPRLAVYVLIDALNDPEWDVRLGAAISLRDLGPAAREAIPALNTALNDPKDVVRQVAAEALQKIQVRTSAPQ